LSNYTFLKTILFISVSAFGGPQGHLLSLVKYFVDKHKVITKEELLNFYSFCSFLPGATSTQLICLIAYRRGGLRLLLPTFLLWITPACLIMLLLSLFFLSHELLGSTDDIFIFFKPMVVAFMIYATVLAKGYYYKKRTDLLPVIVNVILIISLFKHPFVIPILFIINALYAHYYNSGHFKGSYRKFIARLSIDKRSLTLYISLFLTFGFLSEYSRKFETTNRYYFNIIEHNFRFGSVVYGGGDVLIPLLYEQYISRPTSKLTQRRNPDALQLTKDELLTAAGLIRLVPGPVFSITAFTAPFLLKDFNYSQMIFASILACLAIFIPGILILLTIVPFWKSLYQNNTFSNLFHGINLTVFSIMIASSIYLLFDILFVDRDSYVEVSANFGLVILISGLLLTRKLNHISISFLCLALGLVFHFL